MKNPTMNRTAIAAVGLASVLAAGCSSSSGGAKTTTTGAGKSSATSSAPYAPTSADDAATIASHIPGCTNPTAGDIGQGGPNMTSTATCTYTGHLVIIDVWASPNDAVISAELTKPDHIYYAHGQLWTAFLADQGATAATTTLQMQLTNDAGGLTKQAANSDAPTPTPIAAQKQIMTAIAKALSATAMST